MSMGSTGTINVSPEMLTNAKAAISDYRTAVTGYCNQLTEIVNGLIPANFSGEAAEGFKAFHINKIDPIMSDSLMKLLEAMDSMCDGILAAIPADGGVDNQLGSANNQ